MPSLTIPRLILIGKRKAKSIMCEMITLDGRSIDIELPVNRVCLNDDLQGNAFLIDPDEQYRAIVNGRPDFWVQPLVEWCAFPIVTSNDKPQDYSKFKAIRNQLFRDAYQVAVANQYKKAKLSTMTPFLWIVSIFCATFTVIAFLQWRQ